jgi:hypothetical protein
MIAPAHSSAPTTLTQVETPIPVSDALTSRRRRLSAAPQPRTLTLPQFTRQFHSTASSEANEATGKEEKALSRQIVAVRTVRVTAVF